MTLELLIVKNYLKTYKYYYYYYYFLKDYFFLDIFFPFENLVLAKKHIVQLTPFDIFQQKHSNFKFLNPVIELSKQEKNINNFY